MLLFLASWPLIYTFGSFAIFPVVIGFALILVLRGQYFELLISFWYILILSDNFELVFASQVKPIYMVFVFLGALLIFRRYSYDPFIFRSFLPFFMLASVMVFFSPKLDVSLQKYLSYALLVFSAPMYMSHFAQMKQSEAVRGIVYFSLLIMLSCFGYALINESGFSHGGRLRGIFGNPNGLAMFCLFAILYFENVKDRLRDQFKKNEIRLFYIAFFVGIVLSGSRAGMAAVLIFYVFNFISSRASIGVGLISVVTLAATYDVFLELAVQVLTSIGLQDALRLEGSQGVATASGRLVAWKFAWIEIQKHFFFGRGWAYDEIWIFGPIQAVLENFNHQGGVHNTYLILWLNNGLVGLILYVVGLITVIVQAAKRSRFALPVLYAAIFQANFEPWLGASLNPYTILFLLTISLQLNGAKLVEVLPFELKRA